jgi:hypothetical protein
MEKLNKFAKVVNFANQMQRFANYRLSRQAAQSMSVA